MLAISKTFLRPWYIAFLVVTALMLLGTVTGIHAQQSGGVLRIGMNAPQNLDPAFNPNDPETLFNRTIYDYLIEVLPDSTIGPNLASAWEMSEDGLTYTFTLVEGVTFHDGSPLTSADVVFTYNRLKEVESPALGLLGEFEIEAPDEGSVVFTLTQPNADFLYGVGSRWALILKDGTSEPNVLAEGSDNPLVNFNGTGPFILQDYSPGDRAVFVRNENYWQEGPPYLDGVEHIYMEDAVAQINALQGGTVDFIFKIPIDQIAALEGAPDITLLQRPTNQHAVIRLRTDEGFVGSDERVRQAFKMATDREALNDLLMEGLGVVGNNDPIGPLYEPYFASSIENPAYDPAGACALLTEAGYADGLNLTLFTPDSFNYADLAAALQQQWAEGCINVTIEVRPENVYYADTEWLDVELGITGWGSRPIPQSYLLEAYVTDGIYNETRWSDPELDALVEQAGVTSDQEERAAIYAQIAEIFNERGPIIIPWFAPMLGAVRSHVAGLEMAPFPGLTDVRPVNLTS